MKKLYKSEKNKVLSGVLGGVAEYFEIDPTIVRLGYILITIMTNGLPGVLAYIIATLIVPDKNKSPEPPSNVPTSDKK